MTYLKMLPVLLVGLVMTEYGFCAVPMCDCGLYTPSGQMVTRISSVASACRAATEQCTCEVKANFCLRRCVENLNRNRPVSSYRSWQRLACREHAQTLPAPGISMLAGVSLRHDLNCNVRPTFQELPSKPLCCRGSYGTTMFDNMCVW